MFNNQRISLPESRTLLLPRGPTLATCLDLAVQDWREGMTKFHMTTEPATRAAFICDQFYSHARAQFAGYDGFAYDKVQGQRYLAFDERLLVRIKHFDRALKTRSYPTEQAIEWERQGHLEGFPPCERLNLGYRLDLTATRTKDAFVTLPNGNRVVINDWVWQIWGDPLDLEIYGQQMAFQQLQDPQRVTYAYDNFEPRAA